MEMRNGLATFGNILIVIDSSRREEICGRFSNCKESFMYKTTPPPPRNNLSLRTILYPGIVSNESGLEL